MAMTEDFGGDSGAGRAAVRSASRGWKAPRVLVSFVVLAMLAAAGAITVSTRDDGKVTATAGPSAGPSASSQPTPTVAQAALFSGEGMQVTRTFTVAPNWELRWQAEAQKGFKIELLDTNRISRGWIVQAPKSKFGSTYVSDKGSFQLRVTAQGPWTIRVVSQSAPGEAPAPAPTNSALNRLFELEGEVTPLAGGGPA